MRNCAHMQSYCCGPAAGTAECSCRFLFLFKHTHRWSWLARAKKQNIYQTQSSNSTGHNQGVAPSTNKENTNKNSKPPRTLIVRRLTHHLHPQQQRPPKDIHTTPHQEPKQATTVRRSPLRMALAAPEQPKPQWPPFAATVSSSWITAWPGKRARFQSQNPVSESEPGTQQPTVRLLGSGLKSSHRIPTPKQSPPHTTFSHTCLHSSGNNHGTALSPNNHATQKKRHTTC